MQGEIKVRMPSINVNKYEPRLKPITLHCKYHITNKSGCLLFNPLIIFTISVSSTL